MKGIGGTIKDKGMESVIIKINLCLKGTGIKI